MAGKTNARWIKILLDDTGGARDISGSTLSVDGVGLDYDTTDVTAYSDGVHYFTLGHPGSEITLTTVFDNTATTGSHTVLRQIVGIESQTFTLTVSIGIKVASTGGDPEFEGEYYCRSYVLSGDMTGTAVLVPGSSTAPAWGTV